MPEETITITKKRYKELLRAESKLSALECNGVDNWDGYPYAMADSGEDDKEDDE